MKLTLLSQEILDLNCINKNTLLDSIVNSHIDQQFNEVFGPSSKCTLNAYWDNIDYTFKDIIPATSRILEYHMAIHDQSFYY